MAGESAEQLLARTQNFVQYHLDLYLGSGGAKGHFEDYSHVGVKGLLPALLLKTVGRKSGKLSILPLIYGVYGGEWVIVASKGGAPDHPAWYLNLLAHPEVEFQVATNAFRAHARVLEGAEREKVWAYMADLYPPYNDYQKTAGGRVIPLVAMRPTEEVPPFKAS